jgi:hypothetical protein
MAKPDLQQVFVDPRDGQPKRLKGKLGLAQALDNVIVATSEANAISAGLEVGGIWVDSSADNVVKFRIS